MPLAAKPRLNKSRGREVSKVDICKFDTNRFRHMTAKQLHKAQNAIGNIFEIPKRDKTRDMLSRYLSALENVRRGSEPLSERSRAAYIRTYKEDPPDEKRVAAMWRRSADEHERKIWDAQAKAGCKLRDEELVARDAERSGQPHTAARLRRKSVIR